MSNFGKIRVVVMPPIDGRVTIKIKVCTAIEDVTIELEPEGTTLSLNGSIIVKGTL